MRYHGPSIWVRLIVYPLVAAFFVFLAIVFILFVSGYDLSFENGRIVTRKTGLIVVSTVPGDASVSLDGEYKDKTPNIPFFKLKITRVPVGKHSLKIEKSGYIPWDGEVNVDSGFASFIDYLYLIPLQKEASPFNLPSSPLEKIITFDKSRALFKVFDKKAKIISLWQLEVDNQKLEKIYEFDASDNNDFKLVSYSYDGEKFIAKKKDSKSGAYEFLILESKKDGKKWNISDSFDINMEKIVFSPYDNFKIYILNKGDLYLINTDSMFMSAVLEKNVQDFSADQRNFYIVQKNKENYGLYKISQNGEKSLIVKSLPFSKNYTVRYLKNENSYLIYIKDDKDLISFINGENNPKLETIAKNVQSFRVIEDEEILYFSTNDGVFAYDLEKNTKYTSIQDGVDCFDIMSNGKNVIYIRNDFLSIVNYDGQYDNRLFEAKSNILCLASSENDRFYFISSSPSGELDLYTFSF